MHTYMTNKHKITYKMVFQVERRILFKSCIVDLKTPISYSRCRIEVVGLSATLSRTAAIFSNCGRETFTILMKGFDNENALFFSVALYF